MSKYAQGLQATDKEKAASLVASQETQAKASVDQFIASLQGQLAKAEQQSAQLLYVYPLDVQAILNVNSGKAELQSALDATLALKAELFS